MVIALLLIPSRPEGYRGDEGPGWRAAVVAHFEQYSEECSRAIGSIAPEQIDLNRFVKQHMLRIKPEKRKSAVDCLHQGKSLWNMLDQVSNGDSKTRTPQKSIRSKARGPTGQDAASEENEPLEEEVGSGEECASERVEYAPLGETRLGDNVSEQETEIPGSRMLNTKQWLSLERQFPNNEGNTEGLNGRIIDRQQFLHASSIDLFRNEPEESAGFIGHSKQNLPQYKAGDNPGKRSSQGSRPAYPVAPMGVRKSTSKRDRSSLSKINAENVAVFAAQQAADEQSQSEAAVAAQGGENKLDIEEEISLDEYYKPGRLGFLTNPENRAFIGAGETLDDWVIGYGRWPGE